MAPSALSRASPLFPCALFNGLVPGAEGLGIGRGEVDMWSGPTVATRRALKLGGMDMWAGPTVAGRAGFGGGSWALDWASRTRSCSPVWSLGSSGMRRPWVPLWGWESEDGGAMPEEGRAD